MGEIVSISFKKVDKVRAYLSPSELLMRFSQHGCWHLSSVQEAIQDEKTRKVLEQVFIALLENEASIVQALSALEAAKDALHEYHKNQALESKRGA